jgi:hypothetical protein
MLGLLLGGSLSLASDPSLSDQLVDLGRQAIAQGRKPEAASFAQQALRLDPQNEAAGRMLSDLGVTRVAMQEPGGSAAPPPPAPGDDQPETSATIEAGAQAERVRTQQLTNDIRDRQERARQLLNQGQATAALDLLRLGINALGTSEGVPDEVRNQLRRELQTQIQSTVRREEQLELDQAEAMRRAGVAEERARLVSDFEQTQVTIKVLMDQYDRLMDQGVYNVLFNGGTGDIQESTAPFFEARLAAQHARALLPRAEAPWAGIYKASFEGMLAQQLQFEELKRYRFLLTLSDVDRASVPFPDTITIEYPPAARWREISEKRIRRYEQVSLDSRDEKTSAIYDMLNQEVSMPFDPPEPLENVLKYIQAATKELNNPRLPNGIPIYVDPAGLQEAEKTMESEVKLKLEGVPLKKSLRLLLKQLDLTYTVKDGLMTITYIGSRDLPIEIKVYPVADLAMIPLSLITGGGGGGMGGMGGGMGGMGGGMGGMGGGMGGMGGGMGGMGGGMGGMGMGGMGGMMCIPPAPPQDPGATDPSTFLQKKSN